MSAQQAETERRIREMVRIVEADEASFGVFSTGEKIAVALMLNRVELLSWWGTILECVHRLGPEWTHAALRVQRDGWDDS